MADMTAPSGQAPAVAPPVRSNEEIVPRIRWVPIGKSNCSLDLNKPIFGYLKFSAKGTKREVFGMSIPGSLITADIRGQEYQANMAKHRRFLAGETGSAQDLPAPKPAKPARKPKPTAQKAQINILRTDFIKKFVRLRVGRFGNPNAGSVTSFGTVISFTDAFSASSSDKTWNLILHLETRRFFLNLESFVGRHVRKGDYRLLKLTE
nr:hypothetical protein [Tanacetum cinerariifolium]